MGKVIPMYHWASLMLQKCKRVLIQKGLMWLWNLEIEMKQKSSVQYNFTSVSNSYFLCQIGLTICSTFAKLLHLMVYLDSSRLGIYRYNSFSDAATKIWQQQVAKFLDSMVYLQCSWLGVYNFFVHSNCCYHSVNLSKRVSTRRFLQPKSYKC